MSAAKRKRVAGDAARARASALFKKAIKKGFSHTTQSPCCTRLDKMHRSAAAAAKLPFIDEFSSFPIRLTSNMRIISQSPVVPLTTHTCARVFLESKDQTSFNNWYRDASRSDRRTTECEIANKQLADKMDAALKALIDARSASLNAFCAAELDALTKARDACVERMQKWDAADVDLEKFIATLDD
jgi:hypothetical protein